METLRVLDGWISVGLEQTGPSGVTHMLEYIVGPNGAVYRRAYGHETPTLYIDANILPPEHSIRLVRITNKPLRIAVKKRLRKIQRLHRSD